MRSVDRVTCITSCAGGVYSVQREEGHQGFVQYTVLHTVHYCSHPPMAACNIKSGERWISAQNSIKKTNLSPKRSYNPNLLQGGECERETLDTTERDSADRPESPAQARPARECTQCQWQLLPLALITEWSLERERPLVITYRITTNNSHMRRTVCWPSALVWEWRWSCDAVRGLWPVTVIVRRETRWDLWPVASDFYFPHKS